MQIGDFVATINQFLPEPQASLLSGMVFGTKTKMPYDFYQALVRTGVLHMVVLSGVNISILCGILAKFLWVFGRRWGSLLTMAGIIGFVLFVGPEPPIIRAAIMGSLTLLGTFFGRQKQGVLTLVIAGLAMIVFNPSVIKTISFQLSFLATAGMMTLGKPRKREKDEAKLIFRLKEGLKTTLAAQLFTFPLIALYFRRISLISPLVNVLVGWVAYPMVGWGIALAIVGKISSLLGQILAYFLWLPLTYFVKMVEFFGRFPLAMVEF